MAPKIDANSSTARAAPIPSSAVFLAAFSCAECGRWASTLALVPPGGEMSLGPPFPDGEPSSTPTWSLWADALWTGWHALGESSVGQVRAALRRRDSASLLALAWDAMSSYCPKCDKWYCRAHWNLTVAMDEGFYDCTYGVCPRFHRRIVDD